MKKLSEFQRALLDATLAEYAGVPREEEIDITPSPEFESQAEDLILKSNRTGWYYTGVTLRRAILIAAIIALLALIALAVASPRRPAKSQNIIHANLNISNLNPKDDTEPVSDPTDPATEETGDYELQDGEYDRIRLEVKLDVEARFSAPAYIEDYYFPVIPSNWTLMKYEHQQGGTPGEVAQLREDQYTNYYYVWKPFGYPSGASVIYMQDSLNAKGSYYKWGEESLMYIFPRSLHDIPGDREITGEVIEVADIIAYVLTIGPIPDEVRAEMGLVQYDGAYYFNEAINTAMPNGERRFYWTDGDSLFTLVVPLSMDDERIIELIRSVREVDHLPEYK